MKRRRKDKPIWELELKVKESGKIVDKITNPSAIKRFLEKWGLTK